MTTGRERRSSVSTINHHNAKLGWQNESNQTDDKKSETGKSYWTQTMESMDLMNSDHKPAGMLVCINTYVSRCKESYLRLGYGK